mgnify:CR=1 FL=1
MILLTSTSDEIRVTTSGTPTVDAYTACVDLSGSTVTPVRKSTAFSSATTLAIVASPASSTYRTLKFAAIRNRHASTSNDVTVAHYDGTTTVELVKVTLSAGECLEYDEGAGWRVRSSSGAIKMLEVTGPTTLTALTTVVLASDVTNNNASANTIADVTGLSFSVTAGETYWFRFVIPYTAAATTTGSRWAVNGPGSPTLLNYTSHYTLTATSETVNSATAYDIPAAANASSLTAGSVAIIEGFITPSSNGTLIARFASEVPSSAIVAKAGALLQYFRVL